MLKDAKRLNVTLSHTSMLNYLENYGKRKQPFLKGMTWRNDIKRRGNYEGDLYNRNEG